MQKRSNTVPQTLISIQSYAGSKGMAGSVLRSKMRSLRQGKMRESKREKENWVSFSLLSCHTINSANLMIETRRI